MPSQKKRKLPVENRADWQEDQENELLAWLDYSLQHKTFDFFEESVAGHLNEEYNVSYTYRQCRGKLYLLWKTRGHETATKVQVLYDTGSRCLNLLERERMRFISQRVIQLADRERHKLLHSPRRLKSASPSVISQSQSYGSIDRISGKKRTREATTAALRGDQDDLDVRQIVSSAEISRNVNSDQLLEIQSHISFLRDQVQQLTAIQRENHTHITFLHTCLRNAEEQQQDLESHIDYLSHTESPRNDQSSMARQLEDQRAQIVHLQKKLERNRYLGSFTSLRCTDDIQTWTIENVQETMHSIAFQTKQLLFGHEDNENFHPPTLDGNESLISLIKRALALKKDSEISMDTISIHLSTFSLQAVIRALTVAALCEWAFEADLLGSVLLSSMLLNEYRNHVRTRDGETALRNLDFAAHQSLLTSELFKKHIIPEYARNMAWRLSKTLSPMFMTGSKIDEGGIQPSAHDQFVTWGNEEERIWKSRRDKLVDIFERALNLKVKFVLSTFQFEIVLHAPGTPFEREGMTAETMQGSAIDVASLSGQPLEVELCLLPSLYAVHQQCIRVDYTNFIRRDVSERDENERLTQAVVVVGGK